LADKENVDQAKPAGRRDLVTIGLLVGAALASIAGFAVLFSMWWTTDVTDAATVLRLASREFVDGRPIVAGKLAEIVELEPADAPIEPIDMALDASDAIVEEQRLSETAADKVRLERLNWIRLRDFLIGVGKAAEGKRAPEPHEQRRLYFKAVPHLEATRDHGFPEGRSTQGYQTLGEVYFHLGRYDDAVINLNQAIENEPLLRRQLLPMIAESQFNAQKDQKDDALASIDEFLKDPALAAQVKQSASLLRIRILMSLALWEQVDAALTQQELLQTADNGLQHQVKLLRAIAAVKIAMGRYGSQTTLQDSDRKAIELELAGTLQTLIELNEKAAKSNLVGLWIGRIKLLQGDRMGAVNAFHDVVRKDQTTGFVKVGAVEIMGGLQEIELLTQDSDGEQSVQAIGYLMSEIGTREGFDHGMVSFKEFGSRLAQGLLRLRRAGEYKAAIDAARSLAPIFDVSEALVQEGLGYQDWAETTHQEGTDFNGQVAESASKLSRQRYRAAGDAFAEAARLRFDSEEYIPTLWSAIEAYQKGRHFTQSIRLLEPYLRQEDTSRQPRGLIAYGKALLAVGQAEAAINAFERCIYEYQDDPLRYEARYYGALAHAETGDINTAKQLLLQNIDSEDRGEDDQTPDLEPESTEWRDSLFALGGLLYELGYRNYLEAEQAAPDKRLELLQKNQSILESAVRRLDVADKRWWNEHNDPRTKLNAYFAARTRVMASQFPRLESQLPDALNAAKRASRLEADEHLQKALVGFRRLSEYLADVDEEQALSKTDQAMLRNCLIFEADVLMKMKKYQEASSVYRAMESRYMSQPAALEAIVGRASCARELGDDRASEMLFRQASDMLKKIPAEWDGKFAETSRFDREGWKQLLDWMIQDFDKQKA
jgi:tetratricopeptide (TPR) repeat protein